MLERYKFGRKCQSEGESFSKFLADLHRLIKTCGYYPACEPTIIRDRIVIDIRDEDIREDILKEPKLTLTQCIEICKAGEAATSHKSSLQPDRVSNITTSQTVKARKPGKCRYCGQMHVFIKENCPAWGKVCSACSGRNHFQSVCKRQSASHKKMKPKVNKVEDISEPLVSGDESGSSTEWMNGVIDNFLHERAVKCRMLIDVKAVSFQIDTGATCNLLPVRYASNITAYGGTLTMWNDAVTCPVGKCRLKLVNPRTGKRYSVEFIVCDDDCKPLLGFRASQQMGLVTIQEDQFERVASVNTETYSEVFDGKLGLLPGLQTLKVNPEATPRIMANRRVSVNLRPALKNELDRME